MTNASLDILVLAGQTLPWVFFAAIIGWCALVALPGMAFRAGYYRVAERAAAWVIRFPSNPTILALGLVVRGNARYLRGDVVGAAADYEAALATRATGPRPRQGAMVGMVTALIELRRDPVRAWALLDSAVRVGSVPGEALLRAHLLLLAGRVDEGDAAFARAHPKVGQTSRSMLFEAWSSTWQGWYLLRRGRVGEAGAILQRAAALDAAPIHSVRARALLAEIATGNDVYRRLA